MNWHDDVPLDPHYFVYPFMHSQGGVAAYQGYNNSHVDELIEAGIMTGDEEIRRQIYYELQDIYHADCPSVPLAQKIGYHFELGTMFGANGIVGWYYNPAYPVQQTYQGIYAYPLWKWNYLVGDVNYDGKVDMKDLGHAAKNYGKTSPPWQPPPEIPTLL